MLDTCRPLGLQKDVFIRSQIDCSIYYGNYQFGVLFTLVPALSKSGEYVRWEYLHNMQCRCILKDILVNCFSIICIYFWLIAAIVAL